MQLHPTMRHTRHSGIAGLLQHAIMHGSRSTVLRPLGWLIGILATLVFSAIRFNAPNWLSAVIAVFTGITVTTYVSAFLYCLLTDKDALRTEKFSIQKRAIEKGFVKELLRKSPETDL